MVSGASGAARSQKAQSLRRTVQEPDFSILRQRALVGTRSRANRRRLSDNDMRCGASDRRWVPARPAQHVHRRRNNGKGRIQSALASAHGGNGERRVETCNAGRAGAHRPSEALHPTRSSDMLPRIARERVPTVPHVAKTRRNVPRRIARERVLERVPASRNGIG